jgi:hypothetical protein
MDWRVAVGSGEVRRGWAVKAWPCEHRSVRSGESWRGGHVWERLGLEQLDWASIGGRGVVRPGGFRRGKARCVWRSRHDGVGWGTFGSGAVCSG